MRVIVNARDDLCSEIYSAESAIDRLEARRANLDAGALRSETLALLSEIVSDTTIATGRVTSIMQRLAIRQASASKADDKSLEAVRMDRLRLRTDILMDRLGAVLTEVGMLLMYMDEGRIDPFVGDDPRVLH